MHTLNQVKLIVTDMDGTLLNSNRELPADFFDILEQLHRRGIRFVIASGRPYPTLEMQFDAWKDRILIMAENGCCIVDNGELVHMQSLPIDRLAYLIGRCRQIPHAHAILSGFHQAYIFETTPKEAREEIGLYYKKVRYIHDISDIPEPICKLAVCDVTGAELHTCPYLSDLRPPYQATLAGYMWVDLSLHGANKGKGLAAIQQKYNISPDETMVFGDYLNDYEMMQQGYFSYAMANAHPDLKSVSRFETLSNDEGGVIHILRKLLASF